MIDIPAPQRRTTAAVTLAFSLLGVFCSVYLLQTAYVLFLRDSSSRIDVALFALGGTLLAVVVLLSWFGVYCLVYRYAQTVRRVSDKVEIDTANEKFDVPSESVRRVWTTGKIYVSGVRGGVAFVFMLVGSRFVMCPKDNTEGLIT
jgi:hypothetical protein